MTQVRTRFAPSPTGYLHIGGARTALFNFLFARHHGGKFILRIEDTDRERSTPEAIQAILDAMNWLELDYDEGPFYQTERYSLYKEKVKELLAKGKAYPCICTPGELDARRQLAQKEKRKPSYDGTCRPAEGVIVPLPTDKPYTVRFRSPREGSTLVNDLIKGDVTFDNRELDDLIISRSDGTPTYNFCVVVDDIEMAITHIIRGDDHLSNTPRQIQLYAALGHELPQFAHVPLILGTDKARLSKRHGATSVDEFRGAGYVAPALMNFLALLGWAPDGETTIMPPQELVARFSLDRVGGSPATLDYQKLDWMNGVYLRAMTPDEYADALVAYLREQGYEWDERTIRASAPLVQEKIARLGEYPAFAGFLFERRDGEAGGELDAGILDEAADTLRDVEPFNAEAVEAALRSLCDRLEVSPRKGLQPIRIAVTGSKISPGLFESIELLGREETLARISAARAEGA